jgi:hypothetical protein
MINFDKRTNHSPYSLTIIKRHAYANIDFTGTIDRDILERAFKGLVSARNFRSNLNACYDFTGSIIELDVKDIEGHASFIAGQFRNRGSIYQLALISDDTLNTALLSIFQMHLSKTKIDVEIFSTVGQAERWLTVTNH